MNTLTEAQMMPRPDPDQMKQPLDFGKLGSQRDERTETERVCLALAAGIEEYNSAIVGNPNFHSIDEKSARWIRMFFLGKLYPF